jgi:hypothetical protein
MSLIILPRWWAYLDTDGKIHVKRYTTDKAIANTERMFYCAGIFEPFEACNYTEAQQKCLQAYETSRFKESKENKS